MTNIDKEEITSLEQNTCDVLHDLRFGVHLSGYRQLLLLIPYYALDGNQSLTKELYPHIAKHFGYISWQSVERASRMAILDAWKRRDTAAWEKYFPGMQKVPSNKLFFATISEWIKKAPPREGRGIKIIKRNKHVRPNP